MDISAASTTRDDQALNDNLPVQEILHRQKVHDSHSLHIDPIRLDSGVADVLLPSVGTYFTRRSRSNPS
jgi:hypothetical protein